MIPILIHYFDSILLGKGFRTKCKEPVKLICFQCIFIRIEIKGSFVLKSLYRFKWILKLLVLCKNICSVPRLINKTNTLKEHCTFILFCNISRCSERLVNCNCFFASANCCHAYPYLFVIPPDLCYFMSSYHTRK